MNSIMQNKCKCIELCVISYNLIETNHYHTTSCDLSSITKAPKSQTLNRRNISKNTHTHTLTYQTYVFAFPMCFQIKVQQYLLTLQDHKQ